MLKQYLARWLEYRALMKYLLKHLSKGASRSSPRYFDGDLEPGMMYMAASRPPARYRVMRRLFQSVCE